MGLYGGMRRYCVGQETGLAEVEVPTSVLLHGGARLGVADERCRV